jgi:membrane protein DedA with SNARE-associated domain
VKATIDFLIRHGYLLLFLWVLVEQLGVPVPTIPLLLAAGALAGSGKLSLSFSLGLAASAALLSDCVWFMVGRRRGSAVLGWICKISLEPDSCVRRTEDLYIRYGAKSLLLAKFVPGFATVASPLAGIFRMLPARFLLFDACGALLWSGSFIGVGYLFSDQLELVGDYALRLGIFLVVLLVGGLTAYILWKYFERKKFLRELRIARISPSELKRKLDSGEQVQIVDLRHSLDFEAEPGTLPGAIHFDPKDIEKYAAEVARDRDIILYCT